MMWQPAREYLGEGDGGEDDEAAAELENAGGESKGEEDVEKIDLFRILRREGLFTTMPRSRSLRRAGEKVYSSL